MPEYVLLDSGPLGIACGTSGLPVPDRCRSWCRTLIARGVVVVVPEIADFEVRQGVDPHSRFRHLSVVSTSLSQSAGYPTHR